MIKVEGLEINQELMAAVREAVAVHYEWEALFKAYLEQNGGVTLGGDQLDEIDLIAEILEAGGYQTRDDQTFEDVVMIGATAMGEGLLVRVG